MIPSHTRTPTLIIGLISLAYFFLSAWLNAHTMISIDEFWYAHRIYQYRSGLPYRDFSPYKTVLGYYVLLLPMLLKHSYLSTLILLKNTLSLINALGFFISAVWLSRYFTKRAVILALLAVIFSETVLAYATQIRVDILAYWFALFALLSLLDKRVCTAGLLLGIAFTISQKIIWYWFASNVGLGMVWLFADRNTTTFKNIIRYNVIIVSVIVIYALFWSWMSSPRIVWDSVVGEASIMYHLDWYARARDLFWRIILTLNPFLFLLAPTTLVSLVTQDDPDFKKRLFLVPTALTVLLCLVPYDQVFPYYMQVTIPAFLLLYASFFSWLIALGDQRAIVRSVPVMLALLSFSAAMIIAHVLRFHLPLPYLMLLIFPVGVLVLLSPAARALRSLTLTLLVMTGVFMGGIYPLSLFAGNVWQENPGYQQANLTEALAWLKGGGGYLAGVELFYGIDQPIAGLRHLIGPAIDFLRNPTPELTQVMTASQYEDKTATLPRVIADLNHSHVAFYINNYRIEALPRALKHALNERYLHWWGSLYTYAPHVRANTPTFELAFTSAYRVITDSSSVIIDGQRLKAGQVVSLAEGRHQSGSHTDFRLQRLPPATVPTPDPRYHRDQPARFIF